LPQQTEILIIGGGVIGVCAAYYLAEQGRPVTLVEKDDLGAGSSYGNVGWIATGHAIPLAAPGVLTQGLRWLLDAGSPFYIKPRLDVDLLRWLWHFWAACSEKQMYRSVPVLLSLNRASAALFEELVATQPIDFGYERKGLLHLFTSPRSLKKAAKEAALLQEFGTESTLLALAEVRQFEPQVSAAVINGLFYPDYAHMIPDRFVNELARLAENRGVKIRTKTEVLGFETSGPRIVAVATTRGRFISEQVVLAAGAWSPVIAKQLGLRLLLQPAKGYSLTFKCPAAGPQLPLSLAEAKVAVTPMGDVLRVSSTLELAGFDPSINQRRLAATHRAMGEYLSGLGDLEPPEIWRGYRPTTPDGLPIIGHSRRFENLIVATGHGMLGMTQGPVSGKLVAQIIAGERPAIDLGPLAPERFG
jgi:D-amino-acid dehydrogenase